LLVVFAGFDDDPPKALILSALATLINTEGMMPILSRLWLRMP
jgi:hypothetical protein